MTVYEGKCSKGGMCVREVGEKGVCDSVCSKGGMWEKTCMREVGEKGVCDSV